MTRIQLIQSIEAAFGQGVEKVLYYYAIVRKMGVTQLSEQLGQWGIFAPSHLLRPMLAEMAPSVRGKPRARKPRASRASAALEIISSDGEDTLVASRAGSQTIKETSTFSRTIFRREINQICQLSDDEFCKILAQWVEGERSDIGVRNRLLESRLNNVIAIAAAVHLRRNESLTLMDLVNEGFVGLMRALDKFDPSYGTTFSIWSSYWIKRAIGIAIIQKGRILTAPIRKVITMRTIRTCQLFLQQQLRRPPVESELVTFLNKGTARSPWNADALRYHTGPCLKDAQSLDAPVKGGTSTLGKFIAERTGDGDILERADESQERSITSDYMEGLSARERFAAEHHCFALLLGNDELDCAALGRAMGITREGARQIVKRVRRKLQAKHRARIEGSLNLTREEQRFLASRLSDD